MRLLFCLFLLSISNFLFAQDQSLVGKSYISSVDYVSVNGVDTNGEMDKKYMFYMPKSTRFTIIGIGKDKSIQIEFWRYGLTKEQKQDKDNEKLTQFQSKKDYTREQLLTYNAKNGAFVSSFANNLRFTIDVTDLNSKCQVFYPTIRSFSWGAMTLPIKLRFGNGTDRNFAVEENLNLGLALGYRQQIRGKRIAYYNLLGFAAFGTVKIDSAGLKAINGKPSIPPSSGIAPGLSFGVAGVFQFESSFQAGIFVGFDDCTNDVSKVWKFQGKPWIGIGLGIALFSFNQTQAPKEDQSQGQ